MKKSNILKLAAIMAAFTVTHLHAGGGSTSCTPTSSTCTADFSEYASGTGPWQQGTSKCGHDWLTDGQCGGNTAVNAAAE
jgi:hypothetical protein